MQSSLKKEFMLDPNIVFLNHGSFGATPIPVFNTYQDWQRQLEFQPVKFMARLAPTLLAQAREGLAAYLTCAPDEVVNFTNPTAAINMVARSLNLEPGDEILTSNHEYGPMDRTWEFVAEKTGAKYIKRSIPLPVTTPEEFIDYFWKGVTQKTRVIFLSHITSLTALTFPIKEICARARSAGLLSIIDGAHVPGHIPLDLSDLGADIYAGACHKWLCAPKGAAFLFARREVQELLEPLIISWGYRSEKPSGSLFIDHHEWQGTRDLAAFLSVGAAIKFQAEHSWENVRTACHELAAATRDRINQLTGLEPVSPNALGWFRQMVAVRLPDLDVNEMKTRLYDGFQVEIPVYRWDDQPFLRVSFQGYNDQGDADQLISALEHILPI
ncbi:MAG: aminotransferase class V-fold PLP-dependent enzyme [Anaerolineae bacterium]|nr:aminotransferase class V-fold PLP-dependent enzyme [Anaerolineae bacterium]